MPRGRDVAVGSSRVVFGSGAGVACFLSFTILLGRCWRFHLLANWCDRKEELLLLLFSHRGELGRWRSFEIEGSGLIRPVKAHVKCWFERFPCLHYK